MPFIKMGKGFDTDLEDKPAPTGTYDLEVIGVEAAYKGKQSGKDSTRLIIKVNNHGLAYNVGNVFVYLGHPNPADEPETARFKMRQCKRVCQFFEVPYTEEGYDTDDFANAQGRGELTVGENDRGEPVNEIKFPAVPHETPTTARRGRRSA